MVTWDEKALLVGLRMNDGEGKSWYDFKPLAQARKLKGFEHCLKNYAQNHNIYVPSPKPSWDDPGAPAATAKIPTQKLKSYSDEEDNEPEEPDDDEMQDQDTYHSEDDQLDQDSEEIEEEFEDDDEEETDDEDIDLD